MRVKELYNYDGRFVCQHCGFRGSKLFRIIGITLNSTAARDKILCGGCLKMFQRVGVSNG